MSEGPVAHPVKDVPEKEQAEGPGTPKSEHSSCTEEEEKMEHKARVAELEREAEKDEREEASNEEAPLSESTADSNAVGDDDDECAESAERLSENPMFLTIRIRNVRTINTSFQNFFSSFDLFMLWKDPEAQKSGAIVPEKQKKLHRPHVTLANGLVEQWDLSYDGPMHPIKHKNGDWYYLWHGTFRGTFNTPFELQTFPFDYQKLGIQISVVHPFGGNRLHFEDTREFPLSNFELKYEHPIPVGDRYMPDSVQNAISSDKEFDPATMPVRVRVKQSEEEGYKHEVLLQFEILVGRQVSYYAYKIFLPLLMITSLIFGAYAIPGDSVSGRLSLVIGVFFTVISFLRTAERNIPMVSYQTLLDKYIISCIFMIWLVFLELSVSGLLPYEDKSADTEAAVDMDGVPLPPGITGQNLDFYFGGAIAGVFGLLNIWAIGTGITLKKVWAKKDHDWGVKERKEARRAKRKVNEDEEEQHQRVPMLPFFG